MKNVAKYNLFKGVSTLLTIGTPIITLLCNGEFFVSRSDTAVSAAGVFTLLILVFVFKDKIAEKLRMPAPVVICGAALLLLYMVENIMYPIKMVCWFTLVSTGVDEFTFRRWYKQIEKRLPDVAQDYKHVGFIFTTTKKLEELTNEKDN